MRSVAFGIQATVSFDGILSSASFSGGVAVGSGQIGVFGASSGGFGLKLPGISGSVTFFQASTSGTPNLRNLGGGALGGSVSAGLFSLNYSQSTLPNSPRITDPNGYKVGGLSIGTPGLGGKVEYSHTKILHTKQ